MKTDKEWEARARELAKECAPYEGGHLKAMLQLGREMADARAEEIARAMDKAHSFAVQFESKPALRDEVWREAIKIARSTITKPKNVPTSYEALMREVSVEAQEALERALNGWAKANGYNVSMRVAPPKPKPNPKTREQVLDEALREIRRWYERGTDAERIARSALEWKP